MENVQIVYAVYGKFALHLDPGAGYFSSTANPVTTCQLDAVRSVNWIQVSDNSPQAANAVCTMPGKPFLECL